MILQTNGQFSEIKDLKKTISDFLGSMDRGYYPKALLFGTRAELEKIKTEKTLEERMEKIEKKLEELKFFPLCSELIIIPTESEIVIYGG